MNTQPHQTIAAPRPAISESERDQGLDALRGFLILCVVVGHLPLGIFLGFQPWWWGWLNESIYLFHIPLFFALSCCFARPDWRSLVKSVGTILVPYALWFGFQQFQVLYQKPSVWLAWLARGNFDALQSTLWFLPALASVRVLAALVEATSPRPVHAIGWLGLWFAAFAALPWIITHHQIIPFGLDVALLCLPYIWFVLFVERTRLRIASVSPIGWWLLALGVGMLLYTIEPLKTHSPWHKRVDLAQLSLPQSLDHYLIWMGLGAAWWMAVRRSTSRFLALLGRHSLPIFLLHYEVFKWFMVNPGRLAGGPGYISLTYVIMLAVLGPVALSWVARRIWTGSRWIGL